MHFLIENALENLDETSLTEAQQNSNEVFTNFENVGWPPSC